MFPSEWPASRDIKTLTRLAGKLFICAFTTVHYIEEYNHVERLETLTNGELFYGPLDTIYIHVLSALDPKRCRNDEISKSWPQSLSFVNSSVFLIL